MPFLPAFRDNAEGSLFAVDDPHTLQRFVDAQDPVYEEVCGELRNGRKTTHWMWFVFPQLSGLGRTAMARNFGIASSAEARAYLAHPLLGPRLRQCARLLVDYPDARPIGQILGNVDALKLRSSMTLFLASAPPESIEDRSAFQAVLDRYYGGEPDPLTLELLRSA